MAILNWSKECLVGVRVLDSQHVVLIADLNELHAAMMKSQAKSVADPLLRKLLKHARDHFFAEETLMKAAKYPGLARHRAKHRNFARQVEEYLARGENGNNTMHRPMVNFIRDWLTNHIQEEDQKYRPWLKKLA
jgi:hemerythrin-like metal-binding protein